MKIVAVEKTKLSLPQVAELAKAGPVILTRDGKPLATVKDVSRSDWDSLSLANNLRFQDLIEDSRRSLREQGGIRLEDFRKELGLKAKPRKRTR